MDCHTSICNALAAYCRSSGLANLCELINLPPDAFLVVYVRADQERGNAL